MNLQWLEQTESDVPNQNQWLSAQERICLAVFHIAKRRTDWRLGRWTAKQAVSACLSLPTNAASLANIEIRATRSGAPEVFLHDQLANTAISLSHSAGTALCMVAPHGINVGCDLETIESRNDAFVADYFTDEEQARIARALPSERCLLANLFWSAKESILKALRVGLRLDTRCISITLADEPNRASGQISEADLFAPTGEVWHPFRAAYSGGHEFFGWWRSEDGFVRTVVSDCPLPAPVRILSASSTEEARTLLVD